MNLVQFTVDSAANVLTRRFNGCILSNIVEWMHPIQCFQDYPDLFKEFCIFNKSDKMTSDEIKVFNFLIQAPSNHIDMFYKTKVSEILNDYSEWNGNRNKHIIKTNFMSLIHPLQLLCDDSNDYGLFRRNVYVENMFNLSTEIIQLLDFNKNVLYKKENYENGTRAFLNMYDMFVYKGWNPQINKHIVTVSNLDKIDGFAIYERAATLETAKLSKFPPASTSLLLGRISDENGIIGPLYPAIIDLSEMENHPNINQIEIRGNYIVKIGYLPPKLITLKIKAKRIEFVGRMHEIKNILNHPQINQLETIKIHCYQKPWTLEDLEKIPRLTLKRFKLDINMVSATSKQDITAKMKKVVKISKGVIPSELKQQGYAPSIYVDTFDSDTLCNEETNVTQFIFKWKRWGTESDEFF